MGVIKDNNIYLTSLYKALQLNNSRYIRWGNCPFFYKQIKERSVMVEKCWETQCLENKDWLCALIVGKSMTLNQSKSFVASMITIAK